MKSLTLDSLRRLIGGHRKKDKHESSFKRSESFKRISIKKNYLDRGGKCRNPAAKFAMKKNAVETNAEADTATSTPVLPKTEPNTTTESLIIDYGEWIRCIQQEDGEPQPKKGSESPLEVMKLEKSPHMSSKRFPLSKGSSSELDDGSRTDSAISVSLGRIWMDAPLAMTSAPRSLELPRPVSVVELNPNGQRAHHSLESALKDKKDDLPMPALRGGTSAAFRGSSGNLLGKTPCGRMSSELLSSSKDSGFSFSISIPRLSPVISQGHGFFRKKKPVKSTKYSSSAECRRTPSYCGKNTRGRRNRQKIKNDDGYSDNNLYQVVVNRPPRSLDALKLDPIIFVPPEKRKCTMKKVYEVREIRDYCVPCDAQAAASDAESDDFDKLYEVISEERDDEGTARMYCAGEWTSEEDVDVLPCKSPVQQANYSPNLKRRPVARKKSSRRNIRYVAKPIHRAPSTLKRNRRIVKKANGMCVLFYFALAVC